MKKLTSILAVCSLMISGSMASSAFAEPFEHEENTSAIMKEIEQIKIEDQSYYLEELKQESKAEKASILSEYGFDKKQANNEVLLEEVAKKMVDNSFIYYMDEDGTVYDKNAKVFAQVDISAPAIDDSNARQFAPLAFNNPRINGDNSGAFIRQTSVKGYIGSRTSFTLPSKTTSFNIPGEDDAGFIYNGLEYNVETGSSDYLSMEGGLQVSQVKNDFSAYIRVNGGALKFADDASSATNPPRRFKAGTAFISNLRYEVSTNKVKYYASGTNVDNAAQNLSFTYSRALSNAQLANMRAKRVLGIGTNNTSYNGEQNLGFITLKYTGATLLKADGATSVNYNTSVLDTVLYNNKIYGTAYWPSSDVTYSPTSGDISTQNQKIDTRN